MMSAALPDKPVSTVVELVNKITERVPLEMTPVTTKSESEVKVPVHAQQSNWSAKKRIKKAQLDTLERVYNRTKRPTVSILWTFGCENGGIIFGRVDLKEIFIRSTNKN